MAVFRVNKTSDFTTMSNQHLKNKNLSLKAKGLLSLMLALPDDWGYSIKGLVSICKENETSIKNTLDELKTNGYLKILKLKPNETSSKKIEYIYDIYEQPIENQDIENLPLDNQHLENQKLEKHTQINTNILNIDKPNTNKLNTNNNVIPIVPLVEKRTCEYHISEGSTCSREAKLMIGSTNLCGQHARIYLTKLGESQLLVDLEKMLPKIDGTQKNEHINELFNKFWEAYPKKVSKGNAEKWFEKNAPSDELVNAMISKIELLKSTDQWQERGGQFIPYPATWLNAKGWEDEIYDSEEAELEMMRKEVERRKQEGTW